MTIAIHGLGRMGMQLAHKLASGGHRVIAHNRSDAPRAEAAAFGAVDAPTKQDVLAAFGNETPVIWVMLPDTVTGEQMDEWAAVLPRKSLLIDGGNSDYRNDADRAGRLNAEGLRFLDIGTSGGIRGFENGFCMMAGGDTSAYNDILGALDCLAAPNGGHAHFGPAGAGHFVKMVHNAIEYGMMESLAEGYHVLREGPYAGLDISAAATLWQQGSIVESMLNGLGADITAADPAMQRNDGYVKENGEARWTLETAKARGIPMPSIQAAMDVRLASQKGEVNYATKVLAALRQAFGGHPINKDQS